MKFLLAAFVCLPGGIFAAETNGMVLVPAGEFIMGSLDGDADEAPPRKVYLPAFYIDRFEVTQAEYARFVVATGRKPPIDWIGGTFSARHPNLPVVNVTFDDAAAYAAWAGKRLPTEAEWEKAARGSDGRAFPWGENSSVASAWGEAGKERVWPVGSFTNDVSACGAVDMGGNAWEWTSSWYDAYPGNDQLEIAFGKKYRVIRGGGAIEYYGKPSTRRCSQRGRSVPYGTFDGLGFRCVKEAR